MISELLRKVANRRRACQRYAGRPSCRPEAIQILSYVNASSCALANSGVDFQEMDKGNSLGEQNQMSKEKENLRKHDGLFWLLGFIFCSLVSLPLHAAQP